MYSPLKAYVTLKQAKPSINAEYVTRYKQHYLFQDNDYVLEAGRNMSLRTMIKPLIRVNIVDGSISVFPELSPFMMLKISSEIENEVLKDKVSFSQVWIQDDHALRQYIKTLMDSFLKRFKAAINLPLEILQELKIIKTCDDLLENTHIKPHYQCLNNFVEVIDTILDNQTIKDVIEVQDFNNLESNLKENVINQVNHVYHMAKLIIYSK